MNQFSSIDWHNTESDAAAGILKTDPDKGITTEEAEIRLEEFGENKIKEQKQQSSIVRFLLQFHQPLIYILLGATVFTLFLEEFIDAAVIFAVVLVNALIGFIQESKAIKAISALSRSMSAKATIIRDGKKISLDALYLVPGDLVLLESGDKVPADMRLVKVRDLKVDESMLTGESLPVEKKADVLEENTLLADRTNIAYASSMVTYGRASGYVVATGDATEVGKISESISSADNIETPLTKSIKLFSHRLVFAILGLAALTFLIGLFRGQPLEEIFMASVALAVGAIPEGLPAAVTIMLAIGVSKMAKQRAIIRKLVAVETLGSTTVICSDKTGTLTENQMTVKEIFAGGDSFHVTGTGYSPEGKITKDDKDINVPDYPSLEQCLRCGLICNDSSLEKKGDRWVLRGDPTEGAIYTSAMKGNLDPAAEEKSYPRKDAVPFESEYQYMATLHEHKGKRIIFIKGSLESVLSRMSGMLVSGNQVTDPDVAAIRNQADFMASKGLRVLAFAFKDAEEAKNNISHEDVNDLTLLGIQGMMDPPREEAKEAVALCQKAGIKVKMITGDHALTAASIAGMINIEGEKTNGDSLSACTGKDLADISDEELPEIAEKISVFARIAPDQKLRLVKALQSKGHVVAMTGDGVNDGPALKQADIGIAMGITGTEVAKDAADMILTDDNFASIECAVEEGRGVYDNLTKFIVWTLPTNLGEGFVVLAAIILGTALPILPVQILWINMSTAVLLGLMLAFEPKEPDIMERPPRPPNEPILTRELMMRTMLVGILLLIFSFGFFKYELYTGASEEEARTVAATVFVVLETFYLFNCRSLVKPLSQIGFFSNPWVFAGAGIMMGLQLLFIYLPVMNTLFHTSPISMASWIRILEAGILMFLIVSFEKWMRRKFGRK